MKTTGYHWQFQHFAQYFANKHGVFVENRLAISFLQHQTYKVLIFAFNRSNSDKFTARFNSLKLHSFIQKMCTKNPYISRGTTQSHGIP